MRGIAADTCKCMHVLTSNSCILNLWLHGTVHVKSATALSDIVAEIPRYIGSGVRPILDLP